MVALGLYLWLMLGANAGVIQLSAFGDGSDPVVIVDFSACNPLPVGAGYVAGGVFTNLSDDAVKAAKIAGDTATLLADFQQFGEAASVARFPGIVEFSASSPLSTGDAFDGKSIYFVIGNSVDPLAATDWIIYGDGQKFDAAMEPNFFAGSDFLEITDDQLFSGYLGPRAVFPGTPLEEFGAIRTLYGVLTESPIDSCTVPEPSSVSLVLLGGLALGYHRGRKQRPAR